MALLEALKARLKAHGLSINEDKTRFVRFGRRWQGRGKDKPGVFEFPGFTHIAGKDRSGRYPVMRKTSRKRFHRSLKAAVQWCKLHRHHPVRWQWIQPCRKLRGHFNYYGVRGNIEALARFRHEAPMCRINALGRRSRKMRKSKVYCLVAKHFRLPAPRITHPEGWFSVNPGHPPGRAGCGNATSPVL